MSDDWVIGVPCKCGHIARIKIGQETYTHCSRCRSPLPIPFTMATTLTDLIDMYFNIGYTVDFDLVKREENAKSRREP
jgi:hypothetical protein